MTQKNLSGNCTSLTETSTCNSYVVCELVKEGYGCEDIGDSYRISVQTPKSTIYLVIT